MSHTGHSVLDKYRGLCGMQIFNVRLKKLQRDHLWRTENERWWE